MNSCHAAPMPTSSASGGFISSREREQHLHHGVCIGSHYVHRFPQKVTVNECRGFAEVRWACVRVLLRALVNRLNLQKTARVRPQSQTDGNHKLQINSILEQQTGAALRPRLVSVAGPRNECLITRCERESLQQQLNAYRSGCNTHHGT